MKLGVPKEPEGEPRVGIVPSSLRRLARAGFEVYVERGAGLSANHADSAYEDAGAKIVDRAEVRRCDTVAAVRFPGVEDLAPNANLVCIADPFRHPDRLTACLEAGTTLLSMDLIPRRLSRAQSMDVNSSQDNLAGYAAALMGMAHTSRAIPMMTTSAGTVRPGRVVVMGSGVAGLQAISTSRRMGAVVFASDVRRSAAEQIESVGGTFIDVEGMDDFEDASGYARPLTPEFVQEVNRVVCEVASEADVVITTARTFGGPAPTTIPASAVAGFKAGAVVVDLNADAGGNCELTVPDEVVRVEPGVSVLGPTNLPGTVAGTASMLYSNNLTAFLTSLAEDGSLTLREDDDVLVGAPAGEDLHVEGMGGVLVCRAGVVHPAHTRLAELDR
ncbi:MAG: NAD(P) transhydrogenase subunit alpha [Planctomycetota bacterium]|nr:NAD(P) transhydrogenase subunit alpha [Planctomycetota bacterium]